MRHKFINNTPKAN